MPRTRPTEPDERQTLALIQRSLRERGYPPSQREIAAEVGWSSPSGANNLLRLMEAKGLIQVTPGIPRGLRITDAGTEMISGTVMVAPTEPM